MADTPDQPDDRLLVAQAAQGEREAFGLLVRRYQDRAFNLAYQVLRNRDDALDVAQEAFAKAFVSLASFKGEATFTTWLHRIVVNLAIDTLRRKQRGEVRRYEDARGAPVSGEAAGSSGLGDPAAALESKQVRALLTQGIEALPPAQRTVLILREIEGMSYDEIARTVGCSLGTVMSRLFYGRRKLRRLLAARLADLR